MNLHPIASREELWHANPKGSAQNWLLFHSIFTLKDCLAGSTLISSATLRGEHKGTTPRGAPPPTEKITRAMETNLLHMSRKKSRCSTRYQKVLKELDLTSVA
jgi:hypothetical protein